MSLVPAVTELLLAELLYLQYDNPTRPIFMYINSAGVQVRAGSLCVYYAQNSSAFSTVCQSAEEVLSKIKVDKLNIMLCRKEETSWAMRQRHLQSMTP